MFKSQQIAEYKKQKGIYQAGLKGEEDTLNILTKLDDTFHIFTDVEVPQTENNTSGQLDFVIVGDNGVNIVEVKNINGTITGDIEDNMLGIVKQIKGINQKTKDVYNPYKQVKTHTFKLSKYFKTKKLYSWIDGYVYVNEPINGSKALNVSNSEGKIFDNKDELLSMLASPKERNLTSREKQRVIEVLSELTK